PKRGIEDKSIEAGHSAEYEPTRQWSEGGVLHEFDEGVYELGLSGSGLQLRRSDLEHPCEQQDEKHPAVVPAQPPRHRLRKGDQKQRAPEILAEIARPIRASIGHRRQELRIVVALEPAHASAVDVEKAVSARLDHEEQGDQ